MEDAVSELHDFLDSINADFGLNDRARQLISFISKDDDEAFKLFSDLLIGKNIDQRHEMYAARSHRAMYILKEDITVSPSPIIIRTTEQAGLLAKELLAGLKHLTADSREYRTLHIRQVLDALLESFPDKVLATASSGGSVGIQDHFAPLFLSPITLTFLTKLVCYGCTGRHGVASAEKSAQHTAMYQHQAFNNKISLGQRKKFVRQMVEFRLMERLAQTLGTSKSLEAGEEVCESILTILEVVGYPPDDVAGASIKEYVMAGEDILFSPLGAAKWWQDMLEIIQKQQQDTDANTYQMESIARTLHSSFALASGNSSRICKSHAPATDATEQTSEKLVEEKEEKITNRLVEWGLTDKMYEALLGQLPLLLRTIRLPEHDILAFQATEFDTTKPELSPFIRHPGRYKTIPIGSWRLQLLSLLKEVVCYRNKEGNGKCAMNVIMDLPLSPELQKGKKGKNVEDDEAANRESGESLYNPWPALCAFVFAYPYNDFYHNIFFQMVQAVVLEHHEPTLRVIFQKSKFLTRSLRALTTGSGALKGFIIRVLNLLRLKSQSLPPNAFLAQYLGSHDLWKEDVQHLISLTINQETPIRADPLKTGIDELDHIDLGSQFASKLGFGGVSKWDGTSIEDVDNQKVSDARVGETKRKKKNNKKKKKKK